MDIVLKNIIERDFDFLIMRCFYRTDISVIGLFCKETGIEWSENCFIESISHSVTTSDGESDVEIIFNMNNQKIAFLIEDKIDAIAQPGQAKRYKIRAEKSIEEGRFDKYFIFIVAPQKYLDGNKEASNYDYRISYEQISEVIDDNFDKAIVDKALDESKHGYVPIEDKKVTEFWEHIYEYVEQNYSNKLSIQGKRGESRGSSARWISFNSGRDTTIRIKADRGYVDLEISGYADKFQEFSKKNQSLLDEKQLYVRTASKSLAIRKYTEVIDFECGFYEQIDNIEDAFRKARELQELVKDLKF